MATLEQILQDTMKIFEAQAKEAVEAALSKAYEQYLPHVENDTYYNVRQLSRKWIERFMADKHSEDTEGLFDISDKYSAHSVRQKMYEDNKEAVHAAIGVGLQEEIDNLKIELQNAYRRY